LCFKLGIGTQLRIFDDSLIVRCELYGANCSWTVQSVRGWDIRVRLKAGDNYFRFQGRNCGSAFIMVEFIIWLLGLTAIRVRLYGLAFRVLGFRI